MADAGADQYTFHLEATGTVNKWLNIIQNMFNCTSTVCNSRGNY